MLFFSLTMRRNLCKECSITCRGTKERSSAPDKDDSFVSLVSSRPAHRPICLSCLVLSLWSTLSQALDETTLFQERPHQKKNTAHRLQHGPGQESGSGQSRRRGWPSLAPYPRETEHAENVLDFSGSTLVQCTNHDEGCDTDASLQVPTHAAKKERALQVTKRRAIQFYPHENDTFCSSRRRKGEITNRSRGMMSGKSENHPGKRRNKKT